MKINSKILFARYYNWIYGELPQDLCSFFWGSVLAILLKVFYIPGRLVNPNGTSRFWAGVGAWLLYVFLLYIGSELYCSFMGIVEAERADYIVALPGYLLFLACPLIGATVIAAGLAVFGGLIALFVFTDEIERPKITIIQNTKDWIGAIRGKYCTRIDWTEKK